MLEPTLFRDRPRAVQIVLGGVVPALCGVGAGILVGASSGAYWALAAVVSIGGLLAGFEHEDGWCGRRSRARGRRDLRHLAAHQPCDRGHDAKVSLGSFPPFLAVVTAIIGMLLGALGGRIARGMHERGSQPSTPAAE